MSSAHPRRTAIHEHLTLGERAADALAAFVGSWRFVIAQNVLVLVWIAFNVVALFGWRWDPYPFILLNLAFSWQASNTGPILQLSSNRQATKDRLRDDTEANEVDMLVDLLKQNTQLTEQVERLTRAVHEHITRETGETREAHEPAAARGLTAAQTITQAPTLPAGVRKRQRTRGTKEPPHD